MNYKFLSDTKFTELFIDATNTEYQLDLDKLPLARAALN